MGRVKLFKISMIYFLTLVGVESRKELLRVKVKGSTMLEPLTAVVIISIILTLAAVSFANMIKNHDLGIKTMAKQSIDEIKLDESKALSLKSNSFNYELFNIELAYSNYNGHRTLKQQSFTVSDKSGEELMVKDFLIHHE